MFKVINSFVLKLCILFTITFIVAGCQSKSKTSVTQIEPGIYMIKVSRSNVYLLAGETLALIDTGMPGEGEAIIKVIREIGRKPEEVAYILITHAHMDHIGSLGFLKKTTGARIVASSKETEYIQGTKKTWTMAREGIGGKAFKAVLFFMETFRWNYQPSQVDIKCQGGETIDYFGGIQVIATPGHSPGGLSFYLPQKGVLFCGDALSRVPSLRLPPKSGCSNYTEALESVKKIAALTFETCCFGHGDPITRGADVLVKALVESKR